mmetsp:Transcript_8770/g.20702  ORF Transcript_8770/g.20702 Transcript_8770/m.20702 type:complete len:364 (+) Transcript_8770:459-1550(+)
MEIFNSFLSGKPKALTVTEFVSTTQSGIRVVLNNAKDAKDGEAQLQNQNSDITKILSQLKKELKEREEKENDVQAFTQELSVQMAQSGLMRNLVRGISMLSFEARKDVAYLFRFLLQKSGNVKDGFTVSYLTENVDILRELVHGYKVRDSSAACCGLMLRECARHEELARALLYDECFEQMFGHVQLTQFDIASDAFSTLRALLVTHKKMVAQFLEERFDAFVKRCSELLVSENYVTKRQALRLLLDVLLDRSNIHVMTRYINQPDNLKLCMNLLRDPRRTIYTDALHMFKVFVCNPHKEKEVIKILSKNQSKLVQFLQKMNLDDAEEQAQEDRDLVLSTISALEKCEADPVTPKKDECNGVH